MIDWTKPLELSDGRRVARVVRSSPDMYRVTLLDGTRGLARTDELRNVREALPAWEVRAMVVVLVVSTMLFGAWGMMR